MMNWKALKQIDRNTENELTETARAYYDASSAHLYTDPDGGLWFGEDPQSIENSEPMSIDEASAMLEELAAYDASPTF